MCLGLSLISISLKKSYLNHLNLSSRLILPTPLHKWEGVVDKQNPRWRNGRMHAHENFECYSIGVLQPDALLRLTVWVSRVWGKDVGLQGEHCQCLHNTYKIMNQQ